MPKYINSPESKLFRKREVLFGLYQAKKEITKTGIAIVVEGYLDVIMLHQAGLKNVVAPLGTALTESQMKLVWNHAKEVVLLFDGDNAGMRATQKTVEMVFPFLEASKKISVALLPPENDPDSYLRAHGVDQLYKIIQQRIPVSEYVWQQVSASIIHKNPEELVDAKKKLIDQAETIENYDTKIEFKKFFANKIYQFGQQKDQKSRGKYVYQKPLVSLEKILLATLIKYPTLIEEMAESISEMDFVEQEMSVMLKLIVDHKKEIETGNLSSVLNFCPDFFEEISSEKFRQTAPFLEMTTEINKMKTIFREIYEKYIGQKNMNEEIDQKITLLQNGETASTLEWEQYRYMKNQMLFSRKEW